MDLNEIYNIDIIQCVVYTVRQKFIILFIEPNQHVAIVSCRHFATREKNVYRVFLQLEHMKIVLIRIRC